jgi:hypothetical protein
LLETTLGLFVVEVVADQTLVDDVLSGASLNEIQVPHQEVLEGVPRIVRVVEGDIDQSIKLVTHGSQVKARPAALGAIR